MEGGVAQCGQPSVARAAWRSERSIMHAQRGVCEGGLLGIRAASSWNSFNIQMVMDFQS